MSEPTKYLLGEEQIPSHWINLLPDMPGEPLPPLNPATGQPAVAGVVRTADVYQGPNLSELPDLIVQWAREAPIESLEHPDIGTISAEGYPVRKAQHSPDGFMIAGGPAIAEGQRIDGARTIDFAPTVLHLLGQPVPEELDGRVLVEALRRREGSVPSRVSPSLPA